MTLESALSLNTVRQRTPALGQLADILFTRAEQHEELKEGFRGHPTIGAAVFARALRRDGPALLKTLAEKIVREVNSGTPVNVIFFGSIFGGTGASGMPTLARLLRDRIDADRQPKTSLKFAAAMMLPYFHFDPVQGQADRISADAKNFVGASKAALKYYYHQHSLQVFDTIYLLGDQTPQKVSRTSPGGQTQENGAHVVELLAALAAREFALESPPGDCRLAARKDPETLTWADLPYRGNPGELQEKMERMTRFALSFESVFNPALEELERSGGASKAPWYVDLVQSQHVKLSEVRPKFLVPLHHYCLSYLEWFANIEHSLGRTPGQLVDYRPFAGPTKEDEVHVREKETWKVSSFRHLFDRKRFPGGMPALWNELSDSPHRSKGATGIGLFVSSLFQTSLPGK